MGGDPRLSENVEEILKVLDEVDGIVREKCSQLEKTLQQIDAYQEQMQTLRQRIIQEEQQLRVVMAPAYLANDRESAIAEQQVCWIFKLSLNIPYFLTTLLQHCCCCLQGFRLGYCTNYIRFYCY